MNDKCDFCNSDLVIKRYPCRDFNASSSSVGVAFLKDNELTDVVLHSTDYWAACAECAKFVDSGDIDGLLDRVSVCFGLQDNVPFLTHARYMYKLFFENRLPDAG